MQALPKRKSRIAKEKRKKIAAQTRVPKYVAQNASERLSMDFVIERLQLGQAFRVLTIVYQCTRECSILEPCISITGNRAVAV